MITSFQVQLLGNLRFQFDDHSECQLKKSTRIQLLIAYLLLNRERSCRRDEIAFCFWPDTTDRQARTNLRKLIYDTRKRVSIMDKLICVDDDSLQWQPLIPVSLDVKEFEKALLAAAQMPDADSQHKTLKEAVDLYSADLLVGHYQDWILPERDRLRELHLNALEDLMDLSEEQGDLRCAIRYGHRLLRYDRLHESTYCALIRLYRLCGERGRAIEMYNACEKVLSQILSVHPSPQTQKEYACIMHTH